MPKHIAKLFLFFLSILLIGCSGGGSLGYQPPVLPIKISINTSGELQVSWEHSIQTPYGTFSAELSSNLAELYPEKNGVLIVNVNGVNSVYDLNGQSNITITLDSGYYEQVELRKEGQNWYFETARLENSQTEIPNPEDFIYYYFDAITNQRNYDYLWSLQTENFHQANGSYSDYVSYWNTVDDIYVKSIDLYDQTKYSARSRVKMDFYKDGQGIPVDLVFYLVYDNSQQSWVFDVP